MEKYSVRIDNQTFCVELDLSPDNEIVTHARIDGQIVHVLLPPKNERVDGIEWIVIEDRPYEIICDRDLRWIKSSNGIHRIEIRDLVSTEPPLSGGDGRVKAPIPGLVTQLAVSQGQAVKAGQTLLLLEAMKMENEIRAPRSGQVCAIHISPGEIVARGALLVEIA